MGGVKGWRSITKNHIRDLQAAGSLETQESHCFNSTPKAIFSRTRKSQCCRRASKAVCWRILAFERLISLFCLSSQLMS